MNVSMNIECAFNLLATSNYYNIQIDNNYAKHSQCERKVNNDKKKKNISWNKLQVFKILKSNKKPSNLCFVQMQLQLCCKSKLRY
jgi:hypothetical protein